MKKLIDKLTHLNKEFNIIGVKQSTEDEGALYNDILTMRRITDACELKLSVKIGGCEAKTDIEFCDSIGSNGITAPMIESEFAMQKFIESTIDIQNMKYYINIETKTAYKNLPSILNSPSSKLLTGIVIGRSDLVKSYGYDKSQVDTNDINSIVKDILTQCKQYNLDTLMGGNITPNSSLFIKEMYDNKLLNYIETRNVIIQLTDDNCKNLPEVIKSSLMFESEWLEYKSNFHTKISEKYQNRLTQLKNRL
jgi:hypothetical protein|tara:strand:+ start:1055 stop:1807 length:753 start_codon:yes stop_codon:yes gene_type:complete